MKILLFIGMLFMSMHAVSQTFYTDLYGFRLGQRREAVKNEFGAPHQYGVFEDGFVYEAFSLNPDNSLYIVFEYATNDTNVIWSIQVSGSDDKTAVGIGNTTLGISKAQAERIFGKPSSKENIGEYGQKWDYDKTNFSLEVNTEGKLSSIKILDNSKEIFTDPELEKIPDFKTLQKKLTSGDNADLISILSGELEIYNDNEVHYFQKSVKSEQQSDQSKILSMIRELSKDLSTVNAEDENEYEVNMRVGGPDVLHVIKFKKGHAIKEIVFKYFGGQYLIYEIAAN